MEAESQHVVRHRAEKRRTVVACSKGVQHRREGEDGVSQMGGVDLRLRKEVARVVLEPQAQNRAREAALRMVLTVSKGEGEVEIVGVGGCGHEGGQASPEREHVGG